MVRNSVSEFLYSLRSDGLWNCPSGGLPLGRCRPAPAISAVVIAMKDGAWLIHERKLNEARAQCVDQQRRFVAALT